MLSITTSYTSNASGAGRIVAKGNGKQRTVAYDHSKSPAWNYGNAAGTLGLVLWQGDSARRLAADVAMHVVLHDGRHQFRFLF